MSPIPARDVTSAAPDAALQVDVGTDLDAVRARMKTLYQIDRDDEIRVSHLNPEVQQLYAEFLGEPLGEKSHHLLHTHYAQREVVA